MLFLMSNTSQPLPSEDPQKSFESLSEADQIALLNLVRSYSIQTIQDTMNRRVETILIVADNGNMTEHNVRLQETQEQLSSQTSFFEQMFMQSTMSTIILDPEGWCERINPKFTEIFGVESRDIEGKKYNIFQGTVIP